MGQLVSNLMHRRCEEYSVYDKPIAGLCSAMDSCDVCRAARRADAGYQAYLEDKWAYEIKLENKRTLENAIAHDRNVGWLGWKGNERVVRFFQEGGLCQSLERAT